MAVAFFPCGLGGREGRLDEIGWQGSECKGKGGDSDLPPMHFDGILAGGHTRTAHTARGLGVSQTPSEKVPVHYPNTNQALFGSFRSRSSVGGVKVISAPRSIR